MQQWTTQSHCCAGMLLCLQGYCCSQAGTCANKPEACDGTCQVSCSRQPGNLCHHVSTCVMAGHCSSADAYMAVQLQQVAGSLHLPAFQRFVSSACAGPPMTGGSQLHCVLVQQFNSDRSCTVHMLSGTVAGYLQELLFDMPAVSLFRSQERLQGQLSLSSSQPLATASCQSWWRLWCPLGQLSCWTVLQPGVC